MKVIEKNEKNTVDFAEIEPGDCFKWKDELYVRSDCNQEAVSLSNGTALENMCGDMVTPVNAEVRIVD